MNQMDIEIVRELLTQECRDISEETINKIIEACKDNPWDAPTVYKILRLTNEI